MDWPEVRAWRKLARAKVIAARVAAPAELRAEWTRRLVANLRPLLENAPQPISFYWPLKAEPDFRPLMRELDERGVTVALPVAIKLGEPMTFRPWHRGCSMERGIWNIPIPATKDEVTPATVLAPFVGFDKQNYRLGYGGGFFDRTLARLGDDVSPIGVGYSMFRVPSIHPQKHDLPMTRIVTEAAEGNHEALTSAASGDGSASGGQNRSAVDRLVATLMAVGPMLSRECEPLLDFILWQLEADERPVAKESSSSRDAVEVLRFILPTMRLSLLRPSLEALLTKIDGGR